MKTKRKNIFKSLLALTLALIMVLGVAPISELAGVDWASLFAPKAEAANKTYDIYTYEVSKYSITITDCDRSANGAITIPSKIDGKPVTRIDYGAFFGCSSLTNITIPNSVTSIGVTAFDGCTGLTSINVASNNNYYSDNNGVLFDKKKTKLIRYPEGKLETSYTIPNSVTSIEDRAFAGCRSLTSITIPDSVTSIRYSAFDGCSGLTSITIPNSVTSIEGSVFAGCTGLTSINVASENNCYSSNNGVLFNKEKTELIKYPEGKSETSYTIPNSVTSIRYAAFAGCTGLASITISDSVTSIGGYAFYDCSGLTSITIPNSVTSIGGSAFVGCTGLTSITIPNSVTSIGDSAFSGCSSLTSATIPDSVTSIGDSTFSGCSSLTSATIPDGVTSIGGSAFSGCSSLTNITIPNSVTSIGGCAFYGCRSLTSITIPNGVTTIEDGTFEDCSNLTSVTIPDSVTSIGMGAFYKCKSLTSIIIPDSITDIGKLAFLECSSLASITIPNGVTIIEESAFRDCTGLTSITIPNSITSIEGSAFACCTGLTSITIPDSVTSIGYSAFWGCSNLTSVTLGTGVTSIGDDTFSGCGGLISINVASDNNNFFSKDGVLFNKKKTQLIRYPEGKAETVYTIPNGVTNIGVEAFSGCTGLVSITIPNGVTSIGDWAFWDCTGLTSITIPNSVTSIGDSAFFDCTSLRTAHYTGTSEQWTKVSIGSNNDCLVNCIVFGSGGSVSESNLKTYYGTLEDTVIAAVTNGNASWIGGAIIDGKTYKLSRDSKYQSTINNCKGKKVVFTVKDDEIIWIKPAEDIKTSISCSVNPDSVMYGGKKYSSDTANVIVKISNTLCESDFVGDPEVLANIPELELIIPNAELKIDSNNIFSFNGKQIYSTPVKTLGLGESETFCVTANVKNKKPENAAEPKVGINCTFNVTQGNRSFSKVAYGAFKIINNGYKEPTQENVNNSGDKEYRDKLAKAAQELEKATTAFTLEADISNSLKQIFTQEQLDFIVRMILCEAAMKGAPEETFQEELERKVIEKVFKINTRWLRLFNDKIVVTVAMKTQKYGVVQVEFTYNRQQSLLNNKPYAFYGNVEYKIIKSDKKLPDSVNLSGPTGAIYMADMSAFCKAAYSVAESELKRSYNKVWGDGANEAADIIFGKSVNNILSKTKYGSVSGLAWAIMTAPAKEVKIKCPVDIYVYDKDNKLVAAVEDNKVTLSDPNVDISVDGDTKTVMLYDETYRIEYKSAAESTMDIVISEFAGYDQLLKTTTFEKVPLKIGVNYTQNIDNTYMDDSEYSLTSNEEEKILPTETKLELHAHTSSSEWKVGREATCAEYGWNYNYCDECNEWYEVITTVDHTFGSWQIVTEPTVDSEGLEKRVCSKCGAEETRAISKLEPVQVTDVELDITQKALNVGDTFTLTATVKPDNATDKSVTWSSSNTSVATVDENGVVTAVSEGTATITATASNGVEASCTVTVKQKGDSILKKIFKFIFNIILAPFRAIINLFKKLFGK